MARFLVLGSLLALSALAAGEGAEAKPAPASTAQKASTPANPDHDLCDANMTHSRTCTDQYIPALVDAHAQADHPSGNKEEDAKDRPGVIAQAKQESANDSVDANMEKKCSQPMPIADAIGADATACQAKADCGEFSA